MGTEPRSNSSGIVEDLKNETQSFNVWQAIYICELLIASKSDKEKKYPLEQRGLKFRPFENYEYPPSDIRSLTIEENSCNFVLNFMGLYGVNAAMPRCYHEQVAYQQNVYGKEEVPIQNFLDLFNNRFYWLYYNAWKKYRYHLHLKADKENTISERINAFTGLTSKRNKSEFNLSEITLLKLSGLLTRKARSREGLKQAIYYLFPEFKIKVKEFVPKWIRLTEIPEIGGSSEFCHRLGENSFIGQSVLDYSSRICIEIGPVGFEDYLNFTPKSGYSRKLQELLSLYVNDGIEYDIRLIVESATILSVSWDDPRLLLGSTMWLGKPKEEMIDVYYTYEELTGNILN